MKPVRRQIETSCRNQRRRPKELRWFACRLVYAVACLTYSVNASAQTPQYNLFDPPGGQQSGVRGLGGSNSPPTSTPSGPAGAEEAPPATFVAPAQSAPEPSHYAGPLDESIEPTPVEGSEIVARINGEAVLASDFNWQIDARIKAAGGQIPKSEITRVRQMMMHGQVLALVDTKLLYSEFRQKVPADNIPKIEEQLAEAFEEIEVPRLIKMLQVSDRVALEETLEKSGTTLREVRRQFNERQIAMEWLKQKTPKDQPITHEQMLAYYQEHTADYAYPSQVKWEELAVRFDHFGGDRDAAWQALCEMGNAVWAAVQRNPAVTGPVFAEVAKEKSQGFTARDGGCHDWTTLGALKCEALNDALQTLDVGRMSDGIESDTGFHIIRVLERREAGKTPFTEAQADIREKLTEEQREQNFKTAVAKVREGARVWTLYDGELVGDEIEAAIQSMQKR